jgi:hypothetical protein
MPYYETITSIEGTFRFFDDVTYEVKFYHQDKCDVPIDKEFSLKGYEKPRKTYVCGRTIAR